MSSRPDPSRPKKKLTRRRFLIGAGVTGALIVGFAAWPRREKLNLVARPGETILNGWLKIGSDGQVTVVIPQAEMGQGVYTSLPQVLADELGADWRTVGVEPAPLHPIYANKALIEGATEGMPGFLRGSARWALGEIVAHYELQLTGGSTSMMAFHDTLRHAGAAARVMLCKAAAREWGIDWTECDTANGFVIHKANRMRFAELAAKAAEEDPTSDPPLRARPRLIGTSVPRIDIPSKTDGSARFGIDVRLPGMAYAAVRGGPVDGAKLKSVDAGAAKRRPGVFGVVEGPTWVATVADTWWGAKTALDTLKPLFEAAEKPAGPWMDGALQAALGGGDAKEVFSHGDAKAARGAGAVVADYAVPALAHACLEPMNATARVVDGRAEVWAPTQSVTLATWAVARALGIADDRVTVFPTLLGGGFGRKAEVDACVQAALIARDAQRPVQLIWTREEDFGQDKYRPPARARMRAALTRDGRIAAWDATIAVPDVDASFLRRAIPALGGKGRANGHAVEGALDLPYDIPGIAVHHADVELPVPYGYWRSVGHSFTAFFVEGFIDELAERAKNDPLTFRLRMMKGSPRHAALLRTVAEQAEYGSGAAQGIAVHESFGSIVAMVAEVEPGDNGIRVSRVTAAVDCGHVVNPDIVRAQIEGGIIFGLSAAMSGGMTFAGGYAEQKNFDSAPLLFMAEAPEIEVILAPSGAKLGGVGEVAVPPVAPAVAGAVFAATGKRLRSMPFGPQLA